MNKIRYDITQITSGSIYPENLLDNNQSKVVDSFEINSKFTSNKNFVRLEICSLDNIPVVIDTDFTDYSLLSNAQSAGASGASVVTVDPVKDIKSNSLEGSDLILKYRFLDNLFTAGKTGGNLFVKQISPDRKELKLLSKDLTDEEINSYASSYSKEIAKSNTFNEFYLVAGETFINLLNIKAENNSVIVKLNSALPSNINVNTLVNVLEEISNPQVFECISEVVQEKEKLKRLKGPNFSIEVNDKLTNTTEFLNYNELFSYPVSSSYYELYSLFNEKSAQIAIDHTDYKDFIHFSSAEERLRNFKYKLDLLHSYEDSSYSASLSGLNLPGISGSTSYYDNLIQGVVNNFDHYDRYLYYESSSYSWPKLTSTRPYSTQKSTTSESVSWYSKQLNSASNYDVSNFDLLTNTIPTYIREDSNNEPYLMFVHMIAQHFDNLWIYFKAVSDKYDADNRLNFGVSKDLVKDAIESFGIKLYDSNASLENLFSSYLGEAYNTGSEYITSTVVAASGSNSHLQPIPKDSYQKEVYKRIYHNLPFLIKTKGTQRGLRALINCYGIPDNILDIRTSPGVKPGTDDFFGPTPFLSQSKVAIRLDNTGSIVTGSALSAFSSVVNKNSTYSNDSHEVHVGFNINSDTNKVIRNRTTGSFNIDDYIGDPRIESDANYDSLNIVSKKILEEDITWEDMTSAWEDSNFNWNDDLAFNRSPNGFIRLLKFFDNSLFKQIKDFLPARTVTATGLIIEPHVLNRSKITAPSVSFTNDIYSSSISISTVTGSDGGSFPYAAKQTYTTDYSSSIVSPLGRVKRDVTGEEIRITGEFSGSFLIVQDGELNKSNNLKKSAQPLITMDLTALFQSDPIPPSCTISLKAEYLGDYYRILSAGTGSGDITQTYPSVIGATGSLGLVHDYDTFEFFTLQATATYPYTFNGWYTGSSGAGSLITTSSTLTVDRLDESVHGNVYYARFN